MDTKSNSSSAVPLNIPNDSMGKLLCCAVLKILMYYLYIPVFAFRAPCTLSHAVICADELLIKNGR
jgi:hypothetical protein